MVKCKECNDKGYIDLLYSKSDCDCKDNSWLHVAVTVIYDTSETVVKVMPSLSPSDRRLLDQSPIVCKKPEPEVFRWISEYGIESTAIQPTYENVYKRKFRDD